MEIEIEINMTASSQFALPFPLRPNFLAQIVIPRDMTQAEASRLCNFVQSLAVPEPEKPDGVPLLRMQEIDDELGEMP